MKKDITGVRNRILTMLPILDEYQRRIFLASKAQMLGYGGISCINRISGVSRVTITHGINEIKNQNVAKQSNGGSRKKGGGRKPINESQPGIMQELEELLEGHTKGDPMTPLIWTSKSVRCLENALKERGFRVSYVTVSNLLKELGYILQTNRKDLSTQKQHPDRDEQFEYINEQAKMFFLNNCPVLSIDAKKKELVGNFKNDGKEYHKKG